jgi:thiol-disulfide isomerase/thioredoxin
MMNRKNAGLLFVAILAVLAGCGKPKSISPDQVQVSPVKAEDVMRIVREPGAKAVLVNMWATWCGPCQEEFPDLIKLARRYQGRGLRVVLVSNDDENQLAAVKKFLAEQGADFPTYLKAEKDMPFINGIDSRWTGALPSSFIYDGSGKLKEFWEGQGSYALFEEKVKPILNQ